MELDPTRTLAKFAETISQGVRALAPERTFEFGGGHVTTLLDQQTIVGEIVQPAEATAWNW